MPVDFTLDLYVIFRSTVTVYSVLFSIFGQLDRGGEKKTLTEVWLL